MANNRKNHNRLTRIKRWCKLHYYKLVRLDDPPERIARGVAIGVFMGIFPTPFVGTFLAILGAYILKANKAASVLGSLIMNPLTAPFFWMLSAVVGAAIMRGDSEAVMEGIKNHQIINGARWGILVYMVGNIIVSTVFTLAAYFITKRWIIIHRKHKAMKMAARNGL